MFSRELRHLFGAYAALPFLVILSSHHSCSATNNTSNYCAPFSCGNIRNISYPFRLNTDPESCGEKSFELACENNVRPTLYLNMVKYYVQAINYSDFTIRLVDAAVQKDDCFSLPHHFLLSYAYYNYYEIINSSVLTFLCCKNKMLNPPGYIMDASSCKNGSGTEYSSSSSSSISSPSCVDMEGHSYVMVDGHIINDVPDLCRINLIYPVGKTMTNMSYTDVHDILVYGFELSWFDFCCHNGKENRCNLDEATVKNKYCFQYNLFTNTYRDIYPSLLDLFLEGLTWITCRIDSRGYDCQFQMTTPSVLLSFLIFFSTVILALIGFLAAHLDNQDKRKFLSDVQNLYWDDPYLFKYCPDQIFQRCIPDNEVSNVIKFCHSKARGDDFSSKKMTAKILQSGFYWPTMFKHSYAFCKTCENYQKVGFISKHRESLDNLLLTLKSHHSGDVHRAVHDL